MTQPNIYIYIYIYIYVYKLQHTHKLTMGNSDFPVKIKRNFFQASAVSILEYSRVKTKRLKKNLNGNYSRMLCAVLKKYS